MQIILTFIQIIKAFRQNSYTPVYGERKFNSLNYPNPSVDTYGMKPSNSNNLVIKDLKCSISKDLYNTTFIAIKEIKGMSAREFLNNFEITANYGVVITSSEYIFNQENQYCNVKVIEKDKIEITCTFRSENNLVSHVAKPKMGGLSTKYLAAYNIDDNGVIFQYCGNVNKNYQ
ncbi:hypothetical protein A0H76_727 [Hepatospora eriocheir]|uniref:Uncharacterized protein n=1 Tax=Hepatospora eriocheir TaxID=1081669 RepID=A0A1X0Q708_9MICR|nr:hypothetical protein A0H76_727 [Hepatospora eriocheir]